MDPVMSNVHQLKWVMIPRYLATPYLKMQYIHCNLISRLGYYSKLFKGDLEPKMFRILKRLKI